MISYGHHLGEPTLTYRQVRELASFVECELFKLDPSIIAPQPDDYRAEVHWQPWNHFGLSVTIDIGSTVLEFRKELPYGYADFGPDADLGALARGLASFVAAVRSDTDAFEQMRRIEQAIRTKIKRDNLQVEVEFVRFAPFSFHPRPTVPREFRVKVGMLDDLLKPSFRVIEKSTIRTICKELGELGKQQAIRLSRAAELSMIGGILEIEDVAEHAILATGHTLQGIIEQMTPNLYGMPASVILWGNRDHGDHLLVSCRNGRIQLSGSVQSIWWLSSQDIRVHETFPEAITYGLAGRPLSSLVDHPFFLGSAVIAEASRMGALLTRIKLEERARPILQQELMKSA